MPKPGGLANMSTPARDHSHISIILAHNLTSFDTSGSLPQVGALPVLLRAILGAEKAGAARIAVVVDRAARPEIVRELQGTGRLPTLVEWVEPGAGETSLPSVLRQLIDGVTAHVVL